VSETFALDLDDEIVDARRSFPSSDWCGSSLFEKKRARNGPFGLAVAG
jgi:hypothetical protein